MSVPESVSKLEFSRILGVSPSRITAYVRTGKIFGPALVGAGRFQRIVPNIAREQLRKTLHVVQRLANGAARLDQPEPASAASSAPHSPHNDVVLQIQRERLRQMQAARRQRDEEELRRRGVLTPTADVNPALRNLAGRMLNVMDGGLAVMAEAAAAHLQVNRRDLLHVLRTEWRKVRAAAEADFRRELATMPATLPYYPAHHAGDAAAIAEVELRHRSRQPVTMMARIEPAWRELVRIMERVAPSRGRKSEHHRRGKNDISGFHRPVGTSIETSSGLPIERQMPSAFGDFACHCKQVHIEIGAGVLVDQMTGTRGRACPKNGSLLHVPASWQPIRTPLSRPKSWPPLHQPSSPFPRP
jgi:hypothetical protein